MSFLNRFTTISLLPLIVSFVIFYCGTLPENPEDPSNTAISAIIKTSDGKIHNNSHSDTVYKKFSLGAALKLPENFDSIRLLISFKSDTIFDTMFTKYGKSESYFDTLWTEKTLFSPGIYYATFTPFTNLSTTINSTTIDITMVDADVILENHKPSVSISGNTVFRPGDTCVLSITKTDSDTTQILTTTVKGKPDGSLLKDNKFTWVIPSTFTGRDTILFIVTDNGFPQESDTEKVVITVTSTPNAPIITISGDSVVKPLGTCKLTLHISDKDYGQTLRVTMAGQPEGAVLVNDSQFTWTAPNVTSAKHTVTFTVTDNGIPPLSASASVTILVSADSDTQHPTFTVTYNGNGSTSGSVPVDTNKYISGTSVTVAAAGTLVKTGSTFTGWNTNAAGTGIARAAGTLYPKSAANDTLYAQWTTNQTYSVTYIGNGSTSGAVPVDSNKYISGASVTVAAAGTLVKTGSTFAGWNTNAAGTGIARAAGSTYAIGAANDTLYAQWTTNPTYTVTYNGNGSTGGSLPADANRYISGASVTVAAAGTLVKTGSTFAGWNTNAAGTGTARAAGSTYAIGAANDTLYAQWKIKQYSVTYDDNGASGGTEPSDASPHDSASVVTAMANAGNLVKTGSTFDGWNTAADGKGTTYIAGTGTFQITANTILYAKWRVKTYTIRYDGNGNTGGDVPDDETNDSNTTVTVSGNTNGLTKTGFDFNGWNTKADGSGVILAAASKFNIKSDTTLFAQWTVKKYKLTIDPPVNGTVNLSGEVNVDSSAATTITATAASGFKFKYWKVTAGSAKITDTVSASTTVTLTQGNASIKAVFGCLTFNKTISFSEYTNVYNPTVVQGNDGCYYVAFRGFSGDVTPLVVMKFDSNGNTVWKEVYGSDAGSSFIRKTSDGSFLLVGNVEDRINLWKIASNKNQIFSRVADLNTYAYFGFETSDGGYVIAGESSIGGAYAKKTTSAVTGDIWANSYSGCAQFCDGQETTDGGYIFVGDYYGLNVIKTGANGAVTWQNSFTGYTGAASIRQTTDGGYIVGGKVGEFRQTPYSCGLLKISASGTIEWQKTNSLGESIDAVRQTADGGYAYLGYTTALGAGGSDIYLVKTSSIGEISWSKTFGTQEGEMGDSMEICNDGGFILVGSTNDDIVVIKTDENGEVE